MFREEWQEENHVSWDESVFNSLERFVTTKPDENIQRFVETGEVEDLYGDRQLPDPKPHGKHIEYMQAFAENYLSTYEN